MAITGIAIGSVIAALYFGTKKKSPAPEIPEAMLFDVEEAANIVLDDQSTKLQETRKEQEATREKANGTGETAPIETSDDLAYEQQLAKENNCPVADVTITMYAAKDCGVFSAPSEGGKEVSKLKKGDKVIVSKVGESASSQPAPAPEPQPQPAPAPEQPQGNSDVANPNLTLDEMIKIVESMGATFGDVTGEVGVSNFSDHELTIDTSGVTLH